MRAEMLCFSVDPFTVLCKVSLVPERFLAAQAFRTGGKVVLWSRASLEPLVVARFTRVSVMSLSVLVFPPLEV